MAEERTERDLALALLAARAIESLWDVARRRYTGASGTVRYIPSAVVRLLTDGLLLESLNILRSITIELPKQKPDGNPDDVTMYQNLEVPPEGYELPEGMHSTDCPRINLPARQRDQRVYSTSRRRFFPFSPQGSQRA